MNGLVHWIGVVAHVEAQLLLEVEVITQHRSSRVLLSGNRNTSASCSFLLGTERDVDALPGLKVILQAQREHVQLYKSCRALAMENSVRQGALVSIPSVCIHRVEHTTNFCRFVFQEIILVIVSSIY
jgi:hypothetical protein